MSDYLSVLLLSVSPLSELRGAIPAALFVFHLAPLEAYIISVVGNIFVVAFALWAFPNIMFLAADRIPKLKMFLRRYTARIERMYSPSFQRWGALALIFLVAVPLPFTGAWTGALAAFLFRIPFLPAFALISSGVFIAGAFVLGGSLGILHFLSL